MSDDTKYHDSSPVTLSPDWLTHVEVHELHELSRETNSDIFSSLWENSAFCMNRWHHSRPACSLAVMSEQTDAICPSRDSVWRHQTETANSRANSESAVRLLPASYFLLPASFNARLMFLKGSCSGNIQHGRREEKKTSRLVSLMENHQCCSSLTLSASFSSQFQFLIFVSSDFYNICDNYNYCNVTTADL